MTSRFSVHYFSTKLHLFFWFLGVSSKDSIKIVKHVILQHLMYVTAVNFNYKKQFNACFLTIDRGKIPSSSAMTSNPDTTKSFQLF